MGTGGFPLRLLLRNMPFSQMSKAWQWVAVTCLIKDRDYLAFEMETKTPDVLNESVTFLGNPLLIYEQESKVASS